MRSKEEIIDKVIKKYSKKQLEDEKVIQKIQYEAMEIYAKEYTSYFIMSISLNPITCYSVKNRGEDKQFFLGQDYIKRLLDSLK